MVQSISNFYYSSYYPLKIKPQQITKKSLDSEFTPRFREIPNVDMFEPSFKGISVREVKKLFPMGKLEDNYILKEVKNFISRMPEDKKVVDLSPELTSDDYFAMAQLMNACDGKYIDLWKKNSFYGDRIPNCQKLALFVRTLQLTRQKFDILALNETQWKSVINGIIRKPKKKILPLLEYKLDSKDINNALSYGKGKIEVLNMIKEIVEYLNLFKIKKQMTLYRGDDSFGILSLVELPDKRTLNRVTEEFTKNIKSKSEKEIDDFVQKFILGRNINQPRFLSTAMSVNSTKNYAKKIRWTIYAPKGTVGASIESYNIGRENESEFLIQKGAKLKITDAYYNKKEKIWEFIGEIIV